MRFSTVLETHFVNTWVLTNQEVELLKIVLVRIIVDESPTYSPEEVQVARALYDQIKDFVS